MARYEWVLSLIGTLFAIIFLGMSWIGTYSNIVSASWYAYYIVVAIVSIIITAFYYVPKKSLNYIAFAMSIVLLIAMAPTYPYGLLVSVPHLISGILLVG
ncbi:hypothetical protein DRO97_02390 [Archaeoglobales archaeon]|nr:MAG: hypothetical protein DRO97_02390 [Archaeoglobales archaeon]